MNLIQISDHPSQKAWFVEIDYSSISDARKAILFGSQKQNGDKVVNGGRPSAVGGSNISDRLNSIMNNSENWKNRAGKQNDASQFTVHGKMAKKSTFSYKQLFFSFTSRFLHVSS